MLVGFAGLPLAIMLEPTAVGLFTVVMWSSLGITFVTALVSLTLAMKTRDGKAIIRSGLVVLVLALL